MRGEPKLTKAARDFMRSYGRHLQSYIGPCPWNPFPRNSKWGRMIDDAYRRQEFSRRAGRRALAEKPGE